MKINKIPSPISVSGGEIHELFNKAKLFPLEAEINDPRYINVMEYD
jgi:hypothetical protein